jgi:transcriptional regulator with XRE-family HTH domain
MLLSKFLRIERGWSQHDLADRTGLTQGVISMIETGRVNPREGERRTLAQALGCAPERLLDHVADPTLAEVK